MANYRMPPKQHKRDKATTARHAQKRMQKRFDLKLSELEIRQLTNRMRNGEFGPPVWWQSRTRVWYRIQVQNKEMMALLVKDMTITTVYPLEMFERQHGRKVKGETA